MLSRSQAKGFFIWGTVLCGGVFIWLTIDSFARIPAQTHSNALTPEVAHGKELWERENCMGCHTLLGEGAYYAPELTRVYERRGPEFIRAMLTDPAAMYPGERRMQKPELTDTEINSMIAFFKWIGKMDLNGYPPRPNLVKVATVTADKPIAERSDRPKVFNQMCIACHVLDGQGGAVGPALDGVGTRMRMEEIEVWLTDPPKVRPGTKMPKLPLTREDIRELAAFLSKRQN